MTILKVNVDCHVSYLVSKGLIASHLLLVRVHTGGTPLLLATPPLRGSVETTGVVHVRTTLLLHVVFPVTTLESLLGRAGIL